MRSSQEGVSEPTDVPEILNERISKPTVGEVTLSGLTEYDTGQRPAVLERDTEPQFVLMVCTVAAISVCEWVN